MADEKGKEEPGLDPPADEPGDTVPEERAQDVSQTELKPDISRKMSRKQSYFPAKPGSSAEIIDVDRTALEAILDVSSRIQDIQKKSRVSMSTLALAHESYKDKQVNKALI